MKICIVTTQLLGENKIGGFGSMSKQLALSLQEAEQEVVVLVPMRYPKSNYNSLPSSIKIITVEKYQLFNFKFFRAIDADIYHSQNQTILSSIVRLAEPNKKHIITCRDPRNWSDWKNEFINATPRRRWKIPLNYLTEESKFAYWAVQKADVVGVPAKFLVDKVKKMYGLQTNPIFLPNIEEIPSTVPEKSPYPTVLWVGRMAKRKYPEHFIELAAHFPKVNFCVMGMAEEPKRGQYLATLASKYPNIEMLGFKNKFQDTDFYSYFNKACILVNTSSREGLPLTFIEASARGCAILSASNPDDFASSFGYFAENRDFKEGLQYLLEYNRWCEKGRFAHAHVYKYYRKEVAVKQHLVVYKKLMNGDF